MSGLLEGRRAVITGIGDGLGRSLALNFAREGATVVLAARREKMLKSVAAEVEAAGGRALWRSTDVTSDEQCQALVDLAVSELGGIDILVNSAFHPGVEGTSVYSDEFDGSPPKWSPFLTSDLDGVWRDAMEVNFFGTLRMTKACVQYLIESGDGRIVMINTQSTLWIKPGHGAYAASKGALETVTRTLATELGPHGVRVNGVHAGFIWGPPLERALQAAADTAGITLDEVKAGIEAEIPLGYMPPADEVANAALMFATDLAKAVTGQAVAINGGHVV